MRNVAPIFTLLLICLFAVLEMTWAERKNYTIMKKSVALRPMHRPLTNIEIKKQVPKIDGIPKGTKMPHPMTGKVNRKRPTIIGGQPAPTNKFPWMCGILIDDTRFCGGSVISRDFVLTAGHCVFKFHTFEIYMGSIILIDPVESVIYLSTKSFLHPKYRPSLIKNDIALIRLPHAIDNSYITAGRIVPIRLPSQSQASKTFKGRIATLSGWGQTADNGDISDILNFASISIISNEVCSFFYGTRLITRSKLCTWGNLKGGCYGDSGSALQIKECDNIHTQIGIASFGATATCVLYPTAYTRVSSYLAWISGITGLAIRP